LSKRKEEKHIYNKYGLMKMRRIPNALFLSSLGISDKAKNEGMSLKLPSVSIIDTNVSSFGITIPIPGNDQSIDSLNYYHSYLSKIIILGKYNCLLKFKHIVLNGKLRERLLKEDEN
jgi:ribosomal protein S2